jgi:hypothetical protein
MIALLAESVSIHRACRVVLTMGLLLSAGAALADAPLAAPGECAQPREQLVTQPVQVLPAAVAGRAADAFAPTGPASEERPLTSLTDLLGLTRSNTSSTSQTTGVKVEAAEGAVNVGVATNLTGAGGPIVEVGASAGGAPGAPILEVGTTLGDGPGAPILDVDATLNGHPVLPVDTNVVRDTLGGLL